MTKTTRKIVTMIAALTVLAAACGDDGGGSAADTDDPLVQAIVDDAMADGDSISDDRPELECFVSRVVGGIGTDRLNELGVTEANVPDLDAIEWTEDEAERVVDGMFACIDDIEDMFLADMDLGDLDDSQAECVRGVFDEDTLKEFFVATFTNDEEAGAGIFALMGQLAECGVDFDS